ncbi:MAG: methyltransferase domain-containing protein [Candidatus Peribacteraceae bacterium]|nr:methyltransferase domain-containing protein [Candidatus Peribacteraceae bacterium]
MSLNVPDFRITPAVLRRPSSLADAMNGPFWHRFFNETAQEIFTAGGLIVDIGGGLRLDPARGDRVNPDHQKRFGRFLFDPKVQYRVTGYTGQYHPDCVEDIHKLSFADASIDAIICLAVLEHVYDPKRAAEEVTRVLKPGGTGLLYVPFLYRYHAQTTKDYLDYFRYSKDGIAYLFRGCREMEICPVRGLFESLLRFTPLHAVGPLNALLRYMDWGTERMRTVSALQTSGYFIRIRK